MELVDLVDAAIVADLKLDAEIAQMLPRGHDAEQMKGGDDPEDPATAEKPYAITVSSEERGDFRGAPGAGIKLVGVQIEIYCNAEANVDVRMLGRIAGRIGDRLPATQIAEKSRHQAFCNSELLVYGITNTEAERRAEVDLSRTRTIMREFICAQIR